ncbi:sigma-54-dependent Fis family transcriptional regulator [Kosmotoga pacifica]|uniref:sigma-54-dependent Fis family transcriptional regulator n=1 Tax=Kosmotoga pacifica TaxID=1330330 RepID=UPI00069A89AD|nr:sigma-54-dependent Fis family transcriptional regulator [Kosmotoga pacifica]
MKEHLFEEIVNALVEAVLVVDSSGKIILINNEACRILGLKKEDVIGKPVLGTIPNTRLHIVLKTGEPEYDKIQNLDQKTIVTSRIPLKSSDGSVYAVMAVFRDITTVQKLAEEVTNLKEIEALLTAIIDSTHDAISVADEKGRIVLVNKAYTRITGMSPKDVIGKLATVDIAEGSSLHIEVARTQQPIYNARLKVGPARKEVIVNVTPLFVRGEFKGSVGVIHDISEIEKLASELEDARRMLRHVKARYTFDDIAGSSPKLRVAVEQAKRVAKTRMTVLLRGPSGTGKELFAHAIHNASDRANNSFISVNCAALPESILESELFGYKEGAFTGAKKGGKKGLLIEADKGTLFLDEIGKMDITIQSKFLRFLQDKEVTPLGATKPIKVDVRVIAATNLDLERLVEEGKFLADLYYRLNVVPIVIPPLSEHREDIPEIVKVVLMKLNQEYGRLVEGIEEDALRVLMSYSWPGNVRELENVLGRSMINMEPHERIIRKEHLPELGQVKTHSTIIRTGKLSELMAEYEEKLIRETLKKCSGNKTKAARELGISIRTLYYKLERYGIE